MYVFCRACRNTGIAIEELGVHLRKYCQARPQYGQHATAEYEKMLRAFNQIYPYTRDFARGVIDERDLKKVIDTVLTL